MAQLRKSLYTQQPFKGLWVLAAILLTASKLPYWLLRYLPRQFRQHPQWTYRQALMNEIIRALIYHNSVIETRTHIQLNENERFVKIAPSQKPIYHKLLQYPTICPITTGGTWYPGAYKAGDEEPVILHFHGGAFVFGEARPGDVDFAGKTFSKHIKAKTFFPSYRLASNENCHFPAALQDAVTAYQYLLDQGVPAGRIVLSGDSAGAHLAVSLLRYIGDEQVDLPDPGAALLISLWLNLESALSRDYVERNPHYSTDYLPAEILMWGANAYTPEDMDASNPYLSPIKHPFRTRVPLWVQVCGLEMLCDEDLRFADAMRAEGNKVEVYVEPYANHDVLYLGFLTGFEKEAEKVAKAAGEFISMNIK